MRNVLGIMCLVLVATSGCSGIRRTELPANILEEQSEVAQLQRIRSGRGQFLHCNSCHVLRADAPPPRFGETLGPHLEGIVGRSAASVEDFDYTETLRALDLVWDEETLDRWLQQPQAMIPAMCEPFLGIANPGHRRALIAYLKNPGN